MLIMYLSLLSGEPDCFICVVLHTFHIHVFITLKSIYGAMVDVYGVAVVCLSFVSMLYRLECTL